MNKKIKVFLDVILFLIAFAVIQIAVEYGTAALLGYMKNMKVKEAIYGMATGKYGAVLAISTVLSSLLTILLFARLKWTPMSRKYLRSRPWNVFLWIVLLSLGIILPAEWIEEKLQIVMDPAYQKLFDGVMREPWGYVAIGLLAPVAEETVFRGAILRSLLGVFSKKWHWIPILISALLFGLVHGNFAQGAYATVIGLLLGWMYYRTGSILPGLILHWVNNSVAYILFNLMPQMEDGKLIDFFHGKQRLMTGGLIFSFCIIVPSIFQLYGRMKRAKE